VTLYVAGGWGVDALTGRRTRARGDLDLLIDTAQEGLAPGRMQEPGSTIDVDRRPTRFLMTDRQGRAADLHPVVSGADGAAHLAATSVGRAGDARESVRERGENQPPDHPTG
jgi:lincosamide nucleotidyltransferase A/C/D/E